MDCINVLTFVQRGPKNCALLGYYAASSGNFLPTFRDNLSVLSSRVKNSKKRDGQAKPNRVKELHKGGEFREARVDVSWSVWSYLSLVASLGSVTDTLYYNLGFGVC
jgi:hypothetical protein